MQIELGMSICYFWVNISSTFGWALPNFLLGLPGSGTTEPQGQPLCRGREDPPTVWRPVIYPSSPTHTSHPPTHTLPPTYTPTFKDQGAFLCSGRWWHKQWRLWHLLESQPGFPNLNVLDIFHLSLASSWVWPTRWMIIATFDLWQIKMSPDVAY